MNGYDNQGAVLVTDFAQQAGARAFETGQLSKFATYDYVLALDTAAPNPNSQFTAQFEGDFLYIDPAYSVGAISVTLNVANPSVSPTKITLRPGEVYRGRFKGVLLTAIAGACGRLIYGYGNDIVPRETRRAPLTKVSDPTIGGLFVVSNATIGTNAFSINLGSLWCNTAGLGGYRGVALRQGELAISASVAIATPPAPATCEVQLNSAGSLSATMLCPVKALSIVQSGANNLIQIVYDVPEIAHFSSGGAIVSAAFSLRGGWVAGGFTYNLWFEANYWK